MTDLAININDILKLLSELTMTLALSESSKEASESKVAEIESHCSGDPSRLMLTGLGEAVKGNYWVTYRLFVAAHEKMEKEQSKYNNDQKLEVALYVIWSGVKCAYLLRGGPGRHILSECGKFIDMVTQKQDCTSDGEGKTFKPDVYQGYLHFLRGLTYGLSVGTMQPELPDYTCTENELANYKLAKEHLSKPSEVDPRANGIWMINCMKQIKAREKRVKQMQAYFFDRSWSRVRVLNQIVHWIKKLVIGKDTQNVHKTISL